MHLMGAFLYFVNPGAVFLKLRELVVEQGIDSADFLDFLRGLGHRFFKTSDFNNGSAAFLEHGIDMVDVLFRFFELGQALL